MNLNLPLSQDWSDSFTPPLYNSVVLSKRGLSMESVERNKHLIQRLKIQISAYEKLSSTSARDRVISSVMANSTLTALDLSSNSIGDNGTQVLSEALKTNSTLTTLYLGCNSIGDNGAQAVVEAIKTNSTLISLELQNNSIGDNGAQALHQVSMSIILAEELSHGMAYIMARALQNSKNTSFTCFPLVTHCSPYLPLPATDYQRLQYGPSLITLLSDTATGNFKGLIRMWLWNIRGQSAPA
ncbi:hypothetical protein CPB97_008819 [Podila verticillata]|nr:hypothetical protein CPB97_008819 [Podila verticillata]